jgi:hypothetical protein
MQSHTWLPGWATAEVGEMMHAEVLGDVTRAIAASREEMAE